MNLFGTTSHKIDDEKKRIEANKRKISAILRNARLADEILLQQNEDFKKEQAARLNRAYVSSIKQNLQAAKDRALNVVLPNKLVPQKQPGQPIREAVQLQYAGFNSTRNGKAIEYRDEKTNKLAFVDKGREVSVPNPLIDEHVKVGLKHIAERRDNKIQLRGSQSFIQKAALAAFVLGVQDQIKGVAPEILAHARNQYEAAQKKIAPRDPGRVAWIQNDRGDLVAESTLRDGVEIAGSLASKQFIDDIQQPHAPGAYSLTLSTGDTQVFDRADDALNALKVYSAEKTNATTLTTEPGDPGLLAWVQNNQGQTVAESTLLDGVEIIDSQAGEQFLKDVERSRSPGAYTLHSSADEKTQVFGRADDAIDALENFSVEKTNAETLTKKEIGAEAARDLLSTSRISDHEARLAKQIEIMSGAREKAGEKDPRQKGEAALQKWKEEGAKTTPEAIAQSRANAGFPKELNDVLSKEDQKISKRLGHDQAQPSKQTEQEKQVNLNRLAAQRIDTERSVNKQNGVAAESLKDDLFRSLDADTHQQRLGEQLRSLESFHAEREKNYTEAAEQTETAKTKESYQKQATAAGAAKDKASSARQEWEEKGRPTDPATAHLAREAAGFGRDENARLTKADIDLKKIDKNPTKEPATHLKETYHNENETEHEK